MDIKDKLALIEEALDTEEGTLTPETSLDDVEEWDSIGALALIVMLDENFDATISGEQIKALNTIGDILEYMKD